MADLRIPRIRPNPRIYLNGEDVVAMVTQEEMLNWFTEEELQKMISALSAEHQSRNMETEYAIT